MGLLFRNQVHNSLFAQFCPNFLMLRNCYKSASHSFYGYFPNTRAAFLWKRSHGFFSDQWERSSDIVLFTNQWERSYDIVLFTNWWERSYDFFTNQWGKKLTLRRAGQIETTESSSKQSVQLALCVCGTICWMWPYLISFNIISYHW